MSDVDNLSIAITKTFSLKTALFRTFAPSGLVPVINKTQGQVLMTCWNFGGASMQSLSREAGLEKGSLTTVVDSLEALGLVTRTRRESDRRSFIVKPTAKGITLARRIDASFHAHLDELLDKLGNDERARFEKAIRTIARDIPRLME
jgi:DNA-binding MarR family transcriptional regulator